MQFEITHTINLFSRTFKRGQEALLREHLQRDGYNGKTGAEALAAFCERYERRGWVRVTGADPAPPADAIEVEPASSPDVSDYIDQRRENGGFEYDMTDSARELAAALGLDASKIAGTGKDGRVTKADVEAHAAMEAE